MEQRQRVIGVVMISALLALGVLVWLPFQGQDAQYIEQCLAEWGTAHSGSTSPPPPPQTFLSGPDSLFFVRRRQGSGHEHGPQQLPKGYAPSIERCLHPQWYVSASSTCANLY